MTTTNAGPASTVSVNVIDVDSANLARVMGNTLGTYEVLTRDPATGLPLTWIENGLSCSATYNADSTVATLTTGQTTRSFSYTDGRVSLVV